MKIALVWDNFGPLHDDRLDATSSLLAGEADVIGVEINGISDTYSWTNSSSAKKVSIYMDRTLRETSDLQLFWGSLKTLLRERVDVVFLCHYERTGTALLAYALRALGKRVFVMGCPKFDDHERRSLRESMKWPFIAPYQGALVGSVATQAFFRFLGVQGPIERGYNTVSNQRIQKLAGTQDLPSFEDRNFMVIARLVPKKNLETALRAFKLYKDRNPLCRRKLEICGDGPLEESLKALALSLSIENEVVFHGFLQSQEIAPKLRASCALLLVSIEEQYGNVVPESFALGIPVIISDACGARWELVRSSRNGWLVEANNTDGIAKFMELTVAHHETWADMSQQALQSASGGDTPRFAHAVRKLVLGQ